MTGPDLAAAALDAPLAMTVRMFFPPLASVKPAFTTAVGVGGVGGAASSKLDPSLALVS